MPTLSRIAFEADTPLEVTGILLTEQPTQTRRFGATLVGASSLLRRSQER